MRKYWKNWWNRRENIKTFTKQYTFINSFVSSTIAAIIFLLLLWEIQLPIFITLFFLISIINFLNWKYWVLTLWFALFFLMAFLIFKSTISSYDSFEFNGQMNVIRIYDNSIITKFKNLKILINNIQIENNVYSHYKITASGKLNIIKNLNSFNLSQGTFLQLKFEPGNINIEKIPIMNLEYHQPIVKKYLFLILLNIYDNKDPTIIKLKELNIFHYFTVSGFHFGIIFLTIHYLFKKHKISYFVAIILLLIYLIVLNFPISATRAFIFIFIFSINKLYLKNKMPNLSILSITALITVLFDITSIFSLAFILSYGITMIIFIAIEVFSFIKQSWIKNLLILLTAYVFSMLITLSINDKINVLGFIYQFLFLPVAVFSYAFSLLLWWTIYLNYYYFVFLEAFINLIHKGVYFINGIKIPFLAVIFSFCWYELYEVKLLIKKMRIFNPALIH
ncbi:MAG0480 family ComEC-like protein [Mycoplasma phocoeninasale]